MKKPAIKNRFNALPVTVSVPDAVTITGLSKGMIQRLCESGQVLSWRIGDDNRFYWRISTGSLLSFLGCPVEPVRIEASTDDKKVKEAPDKCCDHLSGAKKTAAASQQASLTASISQSKRM